MAIADFTSLKGQLKAARAAFRQEICQQLSLLGGDVTERGECLSVELPGLEGEGARLVAGFNGGGAPRADLGEWVRLRVEAGDNDVPLLTLGWAVEDDDAARLALYCGISGGLNAAGDFRELGDMRKEGARALLDRLGIVAAPARTPVRATLPAMSYRPPAVAAREVLPPGVARAATGRAPPLEELKELLIAEVFAGMKHELLSREACLKGSGTLPAAKAHFIEAGEWAMLGVAYAIDAITSRTAIASFIPGVASWIYGLVGPVLIGGLSSLARSKTDKSIAFGLLASWALTVGWVTASDRGYLDAAQAWFPKNENVARQREAVNIARLDQDAAEKEEKRLEGLQPGSVTGAIAEARKRWQAQELERTARAEKMEAAAKLEAARAKFKEARDFALREQARLERAMLEDPSRKQAWMALFAIFTVINFVGPYAIGRVIEKWRADHGAAKTSAQENHYAREEARMLRENRAAQKALAMQLFGPAVETLLRRGVAVEALNGIDGAKISEVAAERLDRAANPRKYRKGLLWRAIGS